MIVNDIQHYPVKYAAGKLPANFPIAWRGDSNLQDGSDNGVDLSGGLYDAGDSIKFGLPLAFTATLLSWSVLEYSTPMQKAGQLTAATDAIRWVTDYLLKAHTGPDELYYQVQSPNLKLGFCLQHYSYHKVQCCVFLRSWVSSI